MHSLWTEDVKQEWFKCRCEGKSAVCIYCGGAGEVLRETWETEDRQKHMSKIGLVQGPINDARRDPYTKRFVGPKKS